MTSAKLLIHRKRLFADGALSELTLWEVQKPAIGSRHRFKYSLFYGRPGKRMVGYDNEAEKGDHRRYGAVQLPCLHQHGATHQRFPDGCTAAEARWGLI
jgi:hypothetical protein